jgi:hypothetical protein
MTKQNRLLISTISVIAILLWVGATRSSTAQDRTRQFKPGEMVETGGGMFAKILRCRGAGDNEECEVQYYRGDDEESTPRWENADLLRLADERVQSHKRQDVPQPAEVNQRTAAEPQTPEAMDEDQAGNCSYAVPGGDAGRTAKASEQLVKRKIYDNYNIGVGRSGSAPLKVGVTFLAFQMKAGFTNVVRVVPGVGAQRINDAAPPNATIYPVLSTHIVCEQYRDRTLRSHIETKYACFKNKDGDWVCGTDGFPKITQLN